MNNTEDCDRIRAGLYSSLLKQDSRNILSQKLPVVFFCIFFTRYNTIVQGE